MGSTAKPLSTTTTTTSSSSFSSTTTVTVTTASANVASKTELKTQQQNAQEISRCTQGGKTVFTNQSCDALAPRDPAQAELRRLRGY
ncbi:hypothetical protein GCM10008066_27190 [Oxalicibacterium faecigallinarum]|uniref:Uncharacterized protein n=1 Tax=Oxalicibacterium faecigallinarum TaxID=573741 RepID=A0A8J3F4B6_9BURK|nr:hypothetical protein GCM10008066_27190 [Oxalicibacterium faecigallinarum]